MQLANVLAIGKGIADAVAPTRDIFGLDVLPGGCGNDPLFGELA